MKVAPEEEKKTLSKSTNNYYNLFYISYSVKQEDIYMEKTATIKRFQQHRALKASFICTRKCGPLCGPLAEGFLTLRAKKALLCCFGKILVHIGCPVVTLVTLSSRGGVKKHVFLYPVFG